MKSHYLPAPPLRGILPRACLEARRRAAHQGVTHDRSDTRTHPHRPLPRAGRLCGRRRIRAGRRPPRPRRRCSSPPAARAPGPLKITVFLKQLQVELRVQGRGHRQGPRDQEVQVPHHRHRRQPEGHGRRGRVDEGRAERGPPPSSPRRRSRASRSSARTSRGWSAARRAPRPATTPTSCRSTPSARRPSS